MNQIYFTDEEIKSIEKQLGFITQKWHEQLVLNIINMAMNKGVSDLYWNSSDSINSGNTQKNKINYFYERFPTQMGFKESQVELRGRGPERLWHMSLGEKKIASNDMIELSRIPQEYQGAALGILKHRGPYSKNELKKVFEIVKTSKDKSPKGVQAFHYETDNWGGGQRFSQNRSEIVITQRLTKSTLSDILNTNEPALIKFISFIFSQQQHFGNDVIGFALVSPVNNQTWVINEIQTDNINRYMAERAKTKGELKNNTSELTKETIIDMLTAQNKSTWIPKLENENFLNYIISNANVIGQLPTDDSVNESGGVDAWIKSNQEMLDREGVGFQGLNLASKKMNWYKKCLTRKYER